MRGNSTSRRAQIDQALPPDAIRNAFMMREDIAPLPKAEREARWAEHSEKVQDFMSFLANPSTPTMILTA